MTVVGPGDFGDVGDFRNVGLAQSAKHQLAYGMKIASRSFKSMFSGTKYTLATLPLSGKVNILNQLLAENVKSVIDSEVEMFKEEALISAVEKVNSHKTRGRLVLVSS